jgi:hypothetical protein
LECRLPTPQRFPVQGRVARPFLETKGPDLAKGVLRASHGTSTPLGLDGSDHRPQGLLGFHRGIDVTKFSMQGMQCSRREPHVRTIQLHGNRQGGWTPPSDRGGPSDRSEQTDPLQALPTTSSCWMGFRIAPSNASEWISC